MTKRTLAVYQSPIVREKGYVRLPTSGERGDYDTRWKGEWGFKVKRITNAFEPRPGTAVDKAQLEQLISEGWTITVLSK